jgi:hypothetical protein
MNMGFGFVSCHCEDIARGKITIRKHGWICCPFQEHSNYQVVPNGDVFFCCMTRALSEKVGSLNDTIYPDYSKLIKQFPKESLRMQHDPTSLCHICEYSVPYWKYQFIKIKKWIKQPF